MNAFLTVTLFFQIIWSFATCIRNMRYWYKVCYISRGERRVLLLKMNYSIISLYKTMMMLWLNLSQHINGSTHPGVIHNENKLSHIAIWGLLFTNNMLNESLYITFWAVTTASIEYVNCLICIRWKNPNFSFFTKRTKILIFPWNLPTTRCILVQHGVKDLCYMTKQ